MRRSIESAMTGQLPALKIDMVPRTALVPYVNNARTHSEQQVNQIAASMREFGFTNPVLIDDENGIIAGHGRLLAAIKLNMAELPCIRLSGLSETQRKALVLADNKLAMNAGWDIDLLKIELTDLKDAGFTLDLTGFGEIELADLLIDKTAGLTDPDDAPAPQAQAVSELRDVWVMGNHRLVCGDCTTVEAVDLALNGVKPHLMVTDPPYGVEYDAAKARDGSAAIGKVMNDDRADWREAWALFPGHIAYVWHADLRARDVVESLDAADFIIRAQIIWNKMSPVMSRGHYHFQHEPCWYAVRDGLTANWSGDRKQSTVWDIPRPRKSETGHSTQKPVECMKRPIKNNSSPGQAVYEPFSGSGTTIIAAEMTGRMCHAIELSPIYVDVAVRRWQAFTGKQATLEKTGQLFAEVEQCRTKTAA